MAEINVVQLPVTPSAEFTSNDYFLIVNDGKAQQLGRGVLQQWIQNTMRGEKGEQGVAGTNGVHGKNGINGVSAQHSWNGTTLTITSVSGTSSADLKGQDGINGSDGSNGWSPTLAVVEYGDRRVHQVVGWIGGTGVTPEIGQYLSQSGLVSDINQATNIRGSQGVQGVQGIQGGTGEQGEKGQDGTNGVDGKSITTLTYNPDNSINIVYSDDTKVDSNAPNKLTGWASYKDSVYTQTNPLTISANGDVVLPNNATTNVVNYPYGVDSFYNATNQKYLLQDTVGFYSVRIKFKVLASDVPDFLNVTFSKDTTDAPYSEDFPLRGDNKIQEINISTVIYGDSTLASNGMTIRLKTNTRAVSIFGIESIIAKLI